MRRISQQADKERAAGDARRGRRRVDIYKIPLAKDGCITAPNKSWDGIKQLACAVIGQAIDDYRTLTPTIKIWRGSKQSRWAKAHSFLHGNTQGPAGMSMRQFCCELAGIEESALVVKVLGKKWKLEDD